MQSDEALEKFSLQQEGSGRRGPNDVPRSGGGVDGKSGGPGAGGQLEDHDSDLLGSAQNLGSAKEVSKC